MAARPQRRYREPDRSPRFEEAVGRAMLVDDSIREFREQRARRHGRSPVVVPYAGYGSTTWIRVFGRVLIPGSTVRRPRDSARGWRNFTSIPVDRTPVEVDVGGTVHVVHTDHGGVLDARLDGDLAPGWQVVRMRSQDVDSPNAPWTDAPVFVLDPDAPFGIVSDIDDTVMVTALPRPFLAAWNTFVLSEHARAPTPGMSVLYDRLHRGHARSPFIYLSTGAWNVAPTLTRFLSRNLYPSGPLLLTDWGPTPDRIFRSGRAHKVAQLERLALEFPDVKWLLFGDDGQHDEETYGGFAEAHPQNVAAVCIRELSPSEAVFAGGRSRDAHSPSGVLWLRAPDGRGLATSLEQAGLL